MVEARWVFPCDTPRLQQSTLFSSTRAQRPLEEGLARTALLQDKPCSWSPTPAASCCAGSRNLRPQGNALVNTVPHLGKQNKTTNPSQAAGGGTSRAAGWLKGSALPALSLHKPHLSVLFQTQDRRGQASLGLPARDRPCALRSGFELR